LENLLSDVTSKHQAVNEAKSHLEAEKEALTMLICFKHSGNMLDWVANLRLP